MAIDMGNVFIPDGATAEVATGRVTHMGIGAHQDDLEIFAYHGIEECYQSDEKWFAGVTVTDGGGSARVGAYQEFTDEQMKQVRVEEQNKAAEMGAYSLQVQLGCPSSVVKNVSESDVLVDTLVELLDQCRPEVLYLHNPADKHDTHIAVLARCLIALRKLPEESRPKKIYGCEVWRDLDWLDDESKVALKVDRFPELAKDILAVFASQVDGGKDYVTATIGRRQANATFFNSHQVDQASAYTFAIDLMPLVNDSSMTMSDFISSHLTQFKNDVVSRIQKMEQ